jgi:hypothetical protein
LRFNPPYFQRRCTTNRMPRRGMHRPSTLAMPKTIIKIAILPWETWDAHALYTNHAKNNNKNVSTPSSSGGYGSPF